MSIARRALIRLLMILVPAIATAQAPDASPHIQVLSLSGALKKDGKPIWRGTGFYVNAAGTVMTATHVVKDCGHILLVKDGIEFAPTRLMFEDALDVALLDTDRIRGVPAVFADAPDRNSSGAYFASWMDLAKIAPRNATLANALLLASDGHDRSGPAPGQFAMISMAAPGASGAPVMDDEGRVIGMIQSRLILDRVNASGAIASTFAAGLERLKPVMTAAHVPFAQSDQAQLDRAQSRRDRAVGFTVGIYCQA